MPDEKQGKSILERLKAIALGALLLAALGLPAYLTSYNTMKEADDFSEVLVFCGTFLFAVVWIMTLLFTVRAVVKLYSLRLEHPGWGKFFQAINSVMEAVESGGYGGITSDVDVEPLLRPYFLDPISKGGLMRLSIASYFLTIYGYALLYKLISMNYPDAFSANPLDLVTAVYFSVITMATVGYGDVVPVKGATKLLVSTEVLVGVAYTVFFFSVLANLVRDADR